MTKLKIAPFLFGVSLFAISCQNANETKSTTNTTDTAATKITADATSTVMKGVVKQSMQTTNYTYILFAINGADQWVAVPSQTVNEGETYYFKGGLSMNNFESKELKKTFDNILFLERLAKDEAGANMPKQSVTEQTAQPMTTSESKEQNAGNASNQPADYKRQAPTIEKKSVKIEPLKGGITIAELFKNKANYSGKVVKIKGEVTKYTPSIMNKNWLHIQDGSESGGKFDLVVTTNKEVKIGDKIIVEGKINLDKDLGYGYFFDVIMEDATVK